jgi:hypothetical protein
MLYSPETCLFLSLILISVRGSVIPSAYCGQKDYFIDKIHTSSGLESATFGLEAYASTTTIPHAPPPPQMDKYTNINPKIIFNTLTHPEYKCNEQFSSKKLALISSHSLNITFLRKFATPLPRNNQDGGNAYVPSSVLCPCRQNTACILHSYSCHHLTRPFSHETHGGSQLLGLPLTHLNLKVKLMRKCFPVLFSS